MTPANNTLEEKRNPKHYKSRSVQCIEFSRHLDFGCGNAFKYIWREGLKDTSEVERAKIDWYVLDVLVFEPATLHDALRDILVRRISLMRDEFEEDAWSLLVGTLYAASGDYSMLREYANEHKIMKPLAHDVKFGS